MEEFYWHRFRSSNFYHTRGVVYSTYAVITAIDEEENASGDQFRDMLTLEGLRRRDRRIPRCALLDPRTEVTPWK